ncbi:MAG TPA: hypothetical protein DIT25_00780 [Candidatus Moranbacteria bacterium]|nr:hypothetical protein [Candidatus Moranbacteria bacterium]
MDQNKRYPLVIIGAGPAGLAASIYASRFGVENIILGALLGGQISETHHIDNYPGMEDMTGFEFSQKWGNHVKKYGTEIAPVMVYSIKKEGEEFEIAYDQKKVVKAKAILLATGTKRRKLGIIGEEKLSGKGISYCATCDGFFYKNKTVAVIGGSDSAAGAAAYLAEISEKVYLIYRGEKLRAEQHWINLIEKNPKIEVVYKTNVTEAVGENKLEKIKLDNLYDGKDEIAVGGLFIEAGSDPNVDFAEQLNVDMEDGYIKINSDCSTSLPGVWAAGDITNGSDKFRQVITAASEGAIAARSISKYLKAN